MNDEDTKSQRFHRDNFVLLGVLVASWFKIETETLPKLRTHIYWQIKDHGFFSGCKGFFFSVT